MSLSLNWVVALAALVFWVIGTVWFFAVIGGQRKEDENNAAEGEIAAMGWSEAHMLDVVNRYPRSYSAALSYAQQAHGRRDFEEAVRRYRVAINRDPRDIRAYLGAALALREAGQLDEAEVLLRQARRPRTGCGKP
jgi:tetratricopeptide (TPR) repeat protein